MFRILSYFFVGLIAISPAVNAQRLQRITYNEQPKGVESIEIHEGIVSQHAMKIKYKRNGKKVATITLSEPVVVAQANQEEAWGYYQFPSIGRADDGTLIVGWQMKEDSHTTYGKSSSRKEAPKMSKDKGKTWTERDKNYHELRGVNQIRLKDGRIFKILTPASKDIKQYKNFPQQVGKDGRMTFYREDNLPEELRGVYIEDGGQTIHSIINDPGALRYAIDDQMPVQWWGNIKELQDGSLVVGTYPNYYLNEKGQVNSSQVCFFKSTDGGREWNRIGEIPFCQSIEVAKNGWINKNGDYEEPAFTILADSTYICVMRTGMVSPMLESFSYDRGVTWSIPKAISPNGVDPSLLLLKNGVLVLASGRPGIQLRFSFEGKGERWSEPIDFIPYILQDGSYEMNVSCGYPAIIEDTKNSFFIVYSDFFTKNEKDELRKAIMIRRVVVKKTKNLTILSE